MSNPVSSNIHIWILHTDLHTFPLRISRESLFTDQSIFSLVIIISTLITISLGNIWILLGENWCWSLLGLKGLISHFNIHSTMHQLRRAPRKSQEGYSPLFYPGRLRPEVQPPDLCTPTLGEKSLEYPPPPPGPFRIPSTGKRCPLHIPSLENGIPFDCFKCSVF